MIFFAAFTGTGAALAKRLAGSFGDSALAFAPEKYAGHSGLNPLGELKAWCGDIWERADGIVFIGAAGIAVRAIAPYVKSKLTDPAVIVCDERGNFVISLLSGHIGGGNELARRIAGLTGGTPVITTATDVNNKFAVDMFAKNNGLYISSMEKAKEISAAVLQGRTVGFITSLPHGELPECLVKDEREINIEIGHKAVCKNSLLLVPRNVYLGIGCKRGAESGAIENAVNSFLKRNELHPRAIAGIGTIDIKKDEKGLKEYASDKGFELGCYSADELNSLSGSFSGSKFVEKTTGVDCVCERAALLASVGGRLIAAKYAENGVTVAAAEKDIRLGFAAYPGQY